MDLPWDDSPGEDLVEIARSKFMEAEGASKRPNASDYLSVHCDLSQLILGSPLEAIYLRRAILQPTEKIHNEHSKTNGLERLAWPESHTENRGGGFAKE